MNFRNICISAVLSASIALPTLAQEAPPANWFNLDFEADKVRGVSTEKAYQTILKGKKSSPVIVGVIDSGIEIDHPDLKNRLWVNEKEKNGKPGVDDDKNGYIDDVYGWDFIGGKDGKDVKQDTYELVRELVRLKKKFGEKAATDIAPADKAEFELYQEIQKIYAKKYEERKQPYDQLNEQIMPIYNKSKKEIADAMGKSDFNKEELAAFKPQNDAQKEAKGLLERIGMMAGGDFKAIEEYYEYLKSGVEYGLNPDFDPRPVVGDNYANVNERGYGNAEVEGPDAEHGTHVAGIIGADRSNNEGMMGVADNVRIMTIRAVPDGDERDKDIANAIRYAVDNGAKVVNMSFGKDFSPQKGAVDEAVKYAAKKGVLLIHAAGNDGENIDVERNFPTRTYLDGGSAPNWIEVGASDWGSQGGNFVANFSNYGKKMVDVFAPGVDLYSSVPDGKYKNNSGTSMAAPVVAGVAALLLSYYPELTPMEVKDIIIKSAVRFAGKQVNKPGSEDKIDFAELSQTAGVVNAYEAVKMAEEVVKGKKKKK